MYIFSIQNHSLFLAYLPTYLLMFEQKNVGLTMAARASFRSKRLIGRSITDAFGILCSTLTHVPSAWARIFLFWKSLRVPNLVQSNAPKTIGSVTILASRYVINAMVNVLNVSWIVCGFLVDLVELRLTYLFLY